MNQKKKKITTEEFDKIFDDGEEDILQYADMESMTKRINVDFPVWAIEALDTEAKRIGITRQSVIKTWIISELDERKRIEIEKKKLELELKKAS